jgi:energy-coupling factor transporter ATP-binding protein EcfA2
MEYQEYKGFHESEGFFFNPDIIAAIDLLQDTKKHLFITGKAGTGKSTLLRNFLLANQDKQTAVLAPTGIAAVNISGETIHHFFMINAHATVDDVISRAHNPGYKKKLFKQLKTIVIDELSMVRADLFDQMDLFLRIVRENLTPFGGVRIIGFGDLFQLSPVVGSQEKAAFSSIYSSAYFFGAQVYEKMIKQTEKRRFTIVHLNEIYRQKDDVLIGLLNKLRYKEADEDDLAIINRRVISEKLDFDEVSQDAIYLTVTNAKADNINSLRLADLPSAAAVFTAHQEGNYEKAYFPAAVDLELKVGARVMILVNEQEYQNGSLGVITEIDEKRKIVSVLLDETNQIVTVEKHVWEIFEQYYDDASKQIMKHSRGLFEQIPLKLAWAVTVHKSQGQTFSKVIIDLEKHAFAQGQVYVALSRAVSLDGIHLARPIKQSDIRIDRSIQRYMNAFEVSQNKTTGTDVVFELLQQALKNDQPIKMLYVKANTEKETRTVLPLAVEEMVFSGKSYLGLRAFCFKRKAGRNFNIERILEIELVDK